MRKLVIYPKFFILPACCNYRSLVSLDYVSIQMFLVLLDKSCPHVFAHCLDAFFAEKKFVYAVAQVNFFAILMKPSDDLRLNTALLQSITPMLSELHFKPPSVFSFLFHQEQIGRRTLTTIYRDPGFLQFDSPL